MRRTFAVLATTLFASQGALAQSLFAPVPASPAVRPPLGNVNHLAAGDLDDDGDEDLIAGENGGNAIYWQQAGTFVRQPTTAVFGPMTVADFDGDGALDVITAFGRASWGDGTAQFPAAATTFSAPGGYGGPLRHGDFDHDGDLDLLFSAVGNQVHGSVLMRNLGNRSFALVLPNPNFLSLPSGASAAIFVDLDGDTWLDVLQISRDARTRLYWNDQGVFTEATTSQFPLLQLSLRGHAIGDFDGDGDLDVVLGGDADPGVLLRNDGARQVTVVQDVGLPTHTVALHGADQDGDGDVDLLALRSVRGAILRNDGSGHFTAVEAFGGNDELQNVVAVDLDDDGDRDVIATGGQLFFPNDLDARVFVARANAAGPFEFEGWDHLPARTQVIGAAGDVDGDGLSDLAMLVDGTAPLRFATNDGDGVFAHRDAQRAGFVVQSFFADLDDDGRDEFVLGASVNSFLANVDGELGTVQNPLPATGTTLSGTVADLDGNGTNELLLVRQQGQTASVDVLVRTTGVWQNETATRNPAAAIPFSTGSPSRVLPADLDGDGDLDLWLHTDAANQILINDGSGTFTVLPNAVPPVAVGGRFASTGDLDGDGDLDLHTGRFVFLNDGDATFTDASANVPNVNGHESLGRCHDLDDDGDLDLVGQGIVMWNDGLAHFTLGAGVMTFAYPGNTGVVFLGDMDRDGDVDMIVHPSNGAPRVEKNLLRQAWLQGPAPLGGALEFHITTRPGPNAEPAAVWLGCSFAKIAPMLVPDLGWLQIDPGPAFIVGPYLLPAAGGEHVHLEPVPLDPTLQGAYFCAQTIELRAGRLRLGNLMDRLLGN